MHVLALDAHTCDCVLPHRKNSEHTHDSFRSKCSICSTAYRSEEFLGSLLHTNASPTVATHTFLYTWLATNVISFEKLFHGCYSLHMFFPTFML